MGYIIVLIAVVAAIILVPLYVPRFKKRNPKDKKLSRGVTVNEPQLEVPEQPKPTDNGRPQHPASKSEKN